MSTILLVAGLLLVTGLAITLRIRQERLASRHAAEHARELADRVAALEEQLRRTGEHEREWLAVLAHELRSPTGAVMGYAELLRDGTLGDLEPRAADAVLRMAQAAQQVLGLIQGIEEISLLNDPGLEDAEEFEARDIIDPAVQLLDADAQGRGTTIRVGPVQARIRSRRDEAARALGLALGAAIKAAAGRTLLVSAVATDHATTIAIGGANLDPSRDDPAAAPPDTPLTGIGFRIALARATLTRCKGSVDIRHAADGADLLITLPRLAPGSLADTEQEP
jgi:signal transduction histidine kinase